ncbi:GDSL-type esterase/lipase family protein [Aneurinibacillus sp. Ricciae_BoGa-3]|uniref:SGNH/GDSL hydrolase family protein n=1 Tax=Aneurinibacillus sp. Ricciae_BoGa-3 TaxID=3022697 RepID=UPI00233FA8E6|nr:GDSL-type esterase/lipase family protein [Aneurinibacillus sp. Ricciae_BoGa-3]WCK55249.1 GDSL-type esterase/lipase family protein [Aneurinibacillus sp. Ricciae_BoGa-3]
MKIVCFGDSITKGVTYIKGRLRIVKENYPSFLQNFFSENAAADVTVLNKGVFNDNSNLLVKRLDKDVLSEEPDYVIIGIGGNDCNFNWGEVAEHPEQEHEATVPLDRYLDNVKNIVFRIKECGITPIVLTLPPLDPVRYYKAISVAYDKSISHWISMCGGIEHWHGLYNRSLNSLISELDVLKVDIRTAIKNAGDFSALISDDGIHLTPQGYKEMGGAIFTNLSWIK